VQFNTTLPLSLEITEVMTGAAVTVTFSVAVFDRLPESVTLTTKVLVPTLAETGVPDKAPLPATLNHAGPLTFANVRVSAGFGSSALVAIDTAHAWPATTPGSLKGLLMNAGAPFTTMDIVALFDSPPKSVTRTAK